MSQQPKPLHPGRAQHLRALLLSTAVIAALSTTAIARDPGQALPTGAMAPAMAGSDAPAAAGKASVKERTANLTLPAIKLIREDGKPVVLTQEIDDGRPVLVNFIFTSCPGICPISSQTFSKFQSKLGAEAAKVHLVSVSIDPEEDTPPVLRSYAKRYHAAPGWNYYTGSVEASIATQKAFEVYKGDKMSHDPVTLMRIAPGKPWVRIDGFATADDLLHTFHRLQGAS